MKSYFDEEKFLNWYSKPEVHDNFQMACGTIYNSDVFTFFTIYFENKNDLTHRIQFQFESRQGFHELKRKADSIYKSIISRKQINEKLESIPINHEEKRLQKI